MFNEIDGVKSEKRKSQNRYHISRHAVTQSLSVPDRYPKTRRHEAVNGGAKKHDLLTFAS